jgi:hypothetical protein
MCRGRGFLATVRRSEERNVQYLAMSMPHDADTCHRCPNTNADEEKQIVLGLTEESGGT